MDVIKKKTKVMLTDKLGEKVEAAVCPICIEHPDCFAWVEGRCTALNECGGENCVFYKSSDLVIAENKEHYKKLKENGRNDLILKNKKSLVAFGVFDDEIYDADEVSGELEDYAKADFEEQLRLARKSAGLDVAVDENIDSEEPGEE